MSYAIIRTGGKQFRVEAGKKYRIPSVVGEAGGSIEFNDVLLGSDGQNVKTGIPLLSGAKVTGEIIKHGPEAGVHSAQPGAGVRSHNRAKRRP